MRVKLLIIFLAFSGMSFSQALDVKQPSAYFLSHLNHHAGQEDFDQRPHNIFIDFEEKLIWIENDETCELVYKIEFDSAYQGGNQAIVLQEGETMFFTKDWQVQFVIHQGGKNVFSLIMNEGSSHLFGELETEEEIPEMKYLKRRQRVYMTGVKKKDNE